jgi:hypothetical protein
VRAARLQAARSRRRASAGWRRAGAGSGFKRAQAERQAARGWRGGACEPRQVDGAGGAARGRRRGAGRASAGERRSRRPEHVRGGSAERGAGASVKRAGARWSKRQAARVSQVSARGRSARAAGDACGAGAGAEQRA